MKREPEGTPLFAQAEFEAGATAPAAARHWVNELLEQWDLAALRDSVSLLISEVVTNAVRHAASAPTVTAVAAGGLLRIMVTDIEARHLPHLRRDMDYGSEGGRGLHIVQAYSDDWGTNVLSEGKQVWFQLRLPDG